MKFNSLSLHMLIQFTCYYFRRAEAHGEPGVLWDAATAAATVAAEEGLPGTNESSRQ